MTKYRQTIVIEIDLDDGDKPMDISGFECFTGAKVKFLQTQVCGNWKYDEMGNLKLHLEERGDE